MPPKTAKSKVSKVVADGTRPDPVNTQQNYLHELDLTGKQLTTLDKPTFQGLTSLKELYLDENQLTTLDPDTFQSLTSL